MNKPELLAPAGNFECLKAAINNGADAVYLGGKNFSARAFANNFDEEELKAAIKYAHLRDVKIYVTLNTLLNDNELKNALKMADFYYKNNVDALLIQDLGLFYVLKEKYPDFDLHCSTQMHIHNIAGVRNAKELGFARVVLARESDLNLIREACKQDIEVETFVHGAICVSYSGECLMSSYAKNRSANRGMCAQCCRLKYKLVDEDNNTIKTDTDYLLSPKDMFLINDIPELIDAGVSCFKIEGRMKSSAYVGYVTRMYRMAIDDYMIGKTFKPTDEELDNLKVLFNRNFTNDFLYDKYNVFGQKTPNHLGIEIGEVVNNRNDMTYIRLSKRLNQFDGIRINDFGCIVNMLYKDDLLVNSGSVNDVVAIKTNLVLKGKVYKTQDYLLEKQINEYADKRIPLDINVSIYPDKNVNVELIHNDITYEHKSDIIASTAKNAPLNLETVRKQFSKLNDTVYYLNNISLDTDNAFLTVKDLNEIRRNAIEAFDEYRLSSFRRTVKENRFEYKQIQYFDDSYEMILDKDNLSINNEDFLVNYVINSDSKYSADDNVMVCEFGGILQDKNKVAFYTLNCSNSYAYEFLQKLGFKRIVLSTELDDIAIDNLIKEYELRNNKLIRPYVLKDGRRVLMYIKSNPFDKYMNTDKTYYLDDGINRYQIRKKHSITELLEPNSVNKTIDNKQCLPLLIKD